MELDTKAQRKEEKRRKKKEQKALVVDSEKKSKKRKRAKEEGDEKDKETKKTKRDAEVEAYLEKHSITITTTANGVCERPILKFEEFKVPEGLQRAFCNFEEPSPIQACTWPYAMAGKDVVGIAETGSGKTLGFGIPALARLMGKEAKGISVLIVAPTRELAIQTHETLSELGKEVGIGSVAVFGGVGKEDQIKKLKKTKTRIVVGTPGRILDLMEEGACNLSGVDYVVLDEADRMLDKGFENDIRKIIQGVKKERQTMMFSATWPEGVRRLASTLQRDAVRVTVGSEDLTANRRVEQVVEVLDDARQKDERLLAALSQTGAKSRTLVFVLYKKEAWRVGQMLRQQGYWVCELHGDMAQHNRLQELARFKQGDAYVMVATDVAARGLDIPNVETVLNYTFPLTIEDYVHRIGRTGRGGKRGKSVTLFTGDRHERALAGELVGVLRAGGFECKELGRFPQQVRKKEHPVYGAFFREQVPVPAGPRRIVF